MKIARELKCTACERNKIVRPARKAAPPRELDINEVVGIDLMWIPAYDGGKRLALNCIDWGTHFQMVVVLPNKNPVSVREGYRHWIRFFGPPKTIALDQGREFEGSFALRAESDGSFVDVSSVESPYQRGITERNGKTFKLMLSKALENHPCESEEEWKELVDTVAMQKNRLLMKNGFSPIQRVIGYTPRLPGGLLSQDAANRALPDQLRLGDPGVVQSMSMRKAAAQAFFETECSETLRRAISSGPRPFENYQIGELVYFWRVGLIGTKKAAPAYWHGPSRVVMTEQPSTLWLSYQGKLVKASPERVRRAAEEEQVTLTGWIDSILDTKQQLEISSSRGYIDLMHDPLPPLDEYPDENGDDDSTDDHFRPRYRVVGKRRVEDIEEAPRAGMPDEIVTEPVEDLEQPSSSIQTATEDHGEAPELGHGEKREAEEDSTIDQEHQSKRSRIEMLDIYLAKVNALQQTRQRKEVQITNLCKFNKECFRKAMLKEVQNNIKTGAYEPMSQEDSARIKQEAPEKVLESRYVCTAKPIEDIDIDAVKAEGLLLDWDSTEKCKAKVRHVMKGFSEHGAEHLPASTPQVTREAMMLTLQLIASCKWRLGFLDFTQAFHAGDRIDRELYSEQPREGVPGMVPGQLLRLLKTCYGLTDGPYAWYQHIVRVLTKDFGYTQSRADPCLFFLHGESADGTTKLEGIISLATDDMIHGGTARHDQFMETLRSSYKMGKFQHDSGKFTGKDFKMLPDGSIMMSQENYAINIPAISLDPKRKKQRYSLCTVEEISRLRATVGALAWLAKESRPDLAGRTALLQQSFPHPRVLDLVEANQLVGEAREFASSGVRIMPIPLEHLRVGVISDASWGNARQADWPEDSTDDIWEETPTEWRRVHRGQRNIAFHPGSASSGPDLHSILSQRRTTLADGTVIDDDWTRPDSIRALGDAWTGTTTFYKASVGKETKHSDISDVFLKMLSTSSQGGHITMFHDSRLETSQTPEMITVAIWKSTRLKRKTVNTLSAECQAMIQAVGQVHWFRFTLLEALGTTMSNEAWEHTLSSIPYVAVTDSKSLFDCMAKLVCTYTQMDDKRTAIDIAILKDDLIRSGGHVRWVEGHNMLCDPLTKRMKSQFLRAVSNTGKWALSEAGHQQQRSDFDLLLLAF